MCFIKEIIKMGLNKKKVQNLKDPHLRRIRYELRTLLRLEYEKRLDRFYRKLSVIRNDDSLTYEQKRDRLKDIRMRREKFEAMKKRYPINCAICGDRMENLVWNPNRHQWRCIPCYEGAHKRFPKIYP